MNKIKYLYVLFFVALFFSTSCQSGTLIVGQVPENDLSGFTPDDFKGQTIYIYPESEIKEFLSGKILAAKESATLIYAFEKKCQELEKNIPVFNSMEIAATYEKAKQIASDCFAEHKYKQDAASRIYFENLPEAKLTTTIKEDGSFAIRVPSNNKYVFILPKHSITWVNAKGSEKFFLLNGAIDANADVVL